MNRILILTEAGNKIGFGHLTRCTAIKNCLEDHSYDVDLIVNYKGTLATHGGFENMNWLNFQPEFFTENYSIIVVDSYLVSRSWLLGLSGKKIKIVHIDDYNRIIYPVHLIINPNVFGKSIDYSNQNSKCIGGPNYLILRKPFRVKKQKSNYNGKPRLLITLGGSDYRELIPRLIDWSREIDLFEISIIAPEGVKITSKEIRVLPLLDAESMANEIIESEVIISACGQTLHEIASINRPTIGIGIDIDQIENHKFYNSKNFINHNLWWDQDDLEREVKNELVRLANPLNRKKEFKRNIELNQNGVENVINEIINLV